MCRQDGKSVEYLTVSEDEVSLRIVSYCKDHVSTESLPKPEPQGFSDLSAEEDPFGLVGQS